MKTNRMKSIAGTIVLSLAYGWPMIVGCGSSERARSSNTTGVSPRYPASVVGCEERATPVRSKAISRSSHQTPTKQCDAAELPGTPDGRYIDIGHLCPNGKLFMVRTRNIVPFDLAGYLFMLGWSGEDSEELSILTTIPPTPEFSLVYVAGSAKAVVDEISDLRWKVAIDSETKAEQFADLIGGTATRSFFDDARGWEVRSMRAPVTKHFHLSNRVFERLGLCPRRIERVKGGFLIRRSFYIPASQQNPQRLIVSREFVSEDGFYLFGTDREVAREDECPIFIRHDYHVLRQFFREGLVKGN